MLGKAESVGPVDRLSWTNMVPERRSSAGSMVPANYAKLSAATSQKVRTRRATGASRPVLSQRRARQAQMANRVYSPVHGKGGQITRSTTQPAARPCHLATRRRSPSCLHTALVVGNGGAVPLKIVRPMEAGTYTKAAISSPYKQRSI